MTLVAVILMALLAGALWLMRLAARSCLQSEGDGPVSSEEILLLQAWWPEIETWPG